MPIMSSTRPDSSSARYKRFAAIVTDLADDSTAIPAYNQIPVEGLFRLMEMYRYDAFKDDTHSGVLAMSTTSSGRRHHQMSSKSWHLPIKEALDSTMKVVFADKPKEDAVYEVEIILFQMSENAPLTQEQQVQAKSFFSTFEKALVL